MADAGCSFFVSAPALGQGRLGSLHTCRYYLCQTPGLQSSWDCSAEQSQLAEVQVFSKFPGVA